MIISLGRGGSKGGVVGLVFATGGENVHITRRKSDRKNEKIPAGTENGKKQKSRWDKGKGILRGGKAGGKGYNGTSFLRVWVRGGRTRSRVSKENFKNGSFTKNQYPRKMMEGKSKRRNGRKDDFCA